MTCENTLSTSAVLRGNTAAVLIKCMLLLGYSADKPSFAFNKSLRHAMGKVWSHKSHETGHNEQYFTCQTKLQQTMLWACVRYSSCQVF
jgi:hypothetical protein